MITARWVRWFLPFAGLVVLVALPVASQPVPAVSALVSRSAAYVREYGEHLSSVVAVERYDQWRRASGLVMSQPGRAIGRPQAYERRRQLISDYLLLKVPGRPGWRSFRDVLEVDGKRVRDRDDRLSRIFIESPDGALEQAARIAEEGTRFHIGDIPRTINMPTLALLVLTDAHRHRFQFEAAGERRIAGLATRALEYVEMSGPTMIHGAHDSDLAAAGTLWIEPDTGTVLQSVLRTDDGDLASEIVVTYRLDEALELWVPDTMKEHYRSDREQIDGEATYRNFRRFEAATRSVVR